MEFFLKDLKFFRVFNTSKMSYGYNDIGVIFNLYFSVSSFIKAILNFFLVVV